MSLRGFIVNKFETWFFKRVISRELIQGPEHRRNIVSLYGMIVYAARDEFKEDNKPSLDSFLSEAHQEALDNKTGRYIGE